MPQSARSAWQRSAHVPATQSSWSAQTWPHAPQSAREVDTSVHTPPQAWRAPAQGRVGVVHVPPTQTSPVGQEWPHAPQFDASVARLEQLPLQYAAPVGQVTMVCGLSVLLHASASASAHAIEIRRMGPPFATDGNIP